ncbi:transporter (plasmid) [Rhodococcus qingshengii]|nr:transporter [Rhodococcus qingshengii]
MPIIVAWSTPGAALLIASLGGFTFQEAVGAFLVASVVAALFGFTGWFGWILQRIPTPILQALLAGILLPFVIKSANAFESAPILAGSVVVTYLVAKRFAERYAVLAALVVGIITAAVSGSFKPIDLGLTVTGPVWTTPTFSISAIVSIALPLFVVTMASQNAPGLALLRSEGYKPNDRLLVGSISTASAAIAPFGGHAINIAAITAAICTGPESHTDKSRRYVAGVSAGLAYLVVGTFGGFLVSGFQSIPQETISALAAVALLASTVTSLRGAMPGDNRTSAASLITLAVTMSGIILAGVGSAFWGLVAGCAAYFVLALFPRRGQTMNIAPVTPKSALLQKESTKNITLR